MTRLALLARSSIYIWSLSEAFGSRLVASVMTDTAIFRSSGLTANTTWLFGGAWMFLTLVTVPSAPMDLTSVSPSRKYTWVSETLVSGIEEKALSLSAQMAPGDTGSRR